MTKKDSMHLNFKSDFLTGLIVLLPIFATIWILNLVINILSGPVQVLFGEKSIHPIVAFIISAFFITLMGLLARNIIGRAVLNYVESVMGRIPIISTIYKSLKQVIGTFSLKKDKLLSAVLLEYPRKGIWAMGFITREKSEGMINQQGEDVVEGKCSVFVPTTPNPTSGYFIYIDRKDLHELNISIEESIKILMSAGVLSPSSNLDKTVEDINK